MLLLRAVIAGALIFLIFRFGADLRKTLALAAAADYRLLALGLLIAGLGELLTAFKWQRLIAAIGERVALKRLYIVSLVGMFYNNLLPSSVGGDVVRTFLVGPETGGKARAAATIFMQRSTGVAGLLIVANIASWLPPIKLQAFPARVDMLNYIGLWFLLLIPCFLFINAVILSRSVYKWSWKVTAHGEDTSETMTFKQRAAGALRRMHDGLILCRKGLASAVVISIATQLVDSFSVYFAARALGLDLPFQYFCVFVPVTTLAALLPVSINGIGLREACYLALLGSHGVGPEAAVAISLLHFSYIIMLSAIGGLLQLAGFTKR